MARLPNRQTVLAVIRHNNNHKWHCDKISSMHSASGFLQKESYNDSTQSHTDDLNHESFDSTFAANYIPTSGFQRTLLSIGAAGIALCDPSRADAIATLGETTGSCALQSMLQSMENDSEGRNILSERPRITFKTVDLSRLKSMPEGTLGKAYSNFLCINNVSPDTRSTVQFVNDSELAYVMQRYREVHDLIHTVLQMRTNMLGEVTVKWVEAIQTKLPMCVGGAVFGSIRLSKKQRQKYITDYLPWAIRTGWESKPLMNIYFERRWDQSLEDLQKELNIEPLGSEKGTYTGGE